MGAVVCGVATSHQDFIFKDGKKATIEASEHNTKKRKVRTSIAILLLGFKLFFSDFQVYL